MLIKNHLRDIVAIFVGVMAFLMLIQISAFAAEPDDIEQLKKELQQASDSEKLNIFSSIGKKA